MWQMVWLTESAKITRCLNKQVKGIVHPKMNILSSFTHPQVVPNLYECLCSAEHKGRYSEECGKQSSSGAPLTSMVFFFPTMEVNGAPKQPGYKLSSKYLPLCSAEQRNSYRFGTTCGWVNDDRIFTFGWIIPLTPIRLDVSGFWLNPVWPIVCLPLFTLTKTQTLSIPDPWLYCLKPDWFNRTNSFTPCRLAGVAGWLCTSSEKQAALH